MRTLPEPISEASHWLLVCGLAFFLADAASAGLEQRWASDPLPFPATAIAIASQQVAQQPVSQDLVKLLSTTTPPQSATLTTVPGGEVEAQTTREARLSVTLTGSLAGVGGAGLALLALGGETIMASPGQPVADWTVVAVNPTSAVLERLGERQTLELSQPTELATSSAPPVVVPPTEASPQPNRSPQPAADQQATPAAVEPITTQAELLALLDGQMDKFGKQGSLKTVVREGDIIGYQIKVKDPAFPLARLGLQTGDIVLSLNDIPADGPEGLSKHLRNLRNSTSLNFELERGGEKVEHKVQLE